MCVMAWHEGRCLVLYNYFVVTADEQPELPCKSKIIDNFARSTKVDFVMLTEYIVCEIMSVIL